MYLNKMTKNNLRIEYQNKRNLLTEFENNNLSELIIDRFTSHFELDNKKIHLFLPIIKKREINTFKLFESLFDNNCTIVSSKSNFINHTLSHFIITKDTKYNYNSLGIPEPDNSIETSIKDIDIILIPLLVFDSKGNRIGYGKGFYDRFLSQVTENCIKIGLSHFEAYEEELPIDKYDIKLDFCVTPNQVYSFK